MEQQKRVNPVSGIELVRKLAAEGDRIFTMERARELAPAAGISAGYLIQTLHHLTRADWLVRLRNGLYGLCATVPGVTPLHEFEIAMALVHPAAISHWSALHHHGLTEQTPRKVFVLTTTQAAAPRARGHKAHDLTNGYRVGDTTYLFVQTKPAWFFGTEKIWIGDARVTITDPERTLLDGLSMPQYCGDFAEVLHAVEALGNRLDTEKIIGYAIRMGTAVAKRLGWVLEKQGVPMEHLKPLLDVPIKGYRVLDASGPRQGPYNRRWMIQENLPGRISI